MSLVACCAADGSGVLAARLELLCNFLQLLVETHAGAILSALLFHEGGAVVMGALLLRGEKEAKGAEESTPQARAAFARW